MFNYNKVIGTYKVIGEPEAVTRKDKSPVLTHDGKPIVRMFIADSRGVKNQQTNEWENKDEIEIDAKLFGAKAEFAMKYCKKLSRFFIEGKLAMDKWQGDDGKWVRRYYVLVNDIYFLDAKGASEGSGDSGSGNALPPRQTQARSGGTAQPKASGYQEAPMPGEGGANGDMPF